VGGGILAVMGRLQDAIEEKRRRCLAEMGVRAHALRLAFWGRDG
jgi:hypothetical protein